MTSSRGYRWKSEGQRLREARERVGLTQEQVAERLGLTWQTVWQWEAGRSRPAPRNLREVAAVYSVSVDHLLGREAPVSFLPVVGYVPAGDSPPGRVPEETVPFPEIVLKEHPRAFAVVIQGDALAREGFKDAELLVVDPASGLEVDRLYVVRQAEELQVCSVEARDGRIMLRSGTGGTRDITPRDVDILGRVVWHLRRL